jgi:hypothetical protein
VGLDDGQDVGAELVLDVLLGLARPRRDVGEIDVKALANLAITSKTKLPWVLMPCMKTKIRKRNLPWVLKPCMWKVIRKTKLPWVLKPCMKTQIRKRNLPLVLMPCMKTKIRKRNLLWVLMPCMKTMWKVIRKTKLPRVLKPFMKTKIRKRNLLLVLMPCMKTEIRKRNLPRVLMPCMKTKIRRRNLPWVLMPCTKTKIRRSLPRVAQGGIVEVGVPVVPCPVLGEVVVQEGGAEVRGKGLEEEGVQLGHVVPALVAPATQNETQPHQPPESTSCPSPAPRRGAGLRPPRFSAS